MNQPAKITSRDNALPATVQKLEQLEEGFGRRLVQRLDAHEAELGYTVSERLRAARMQALAAAPATNVQVGDGGTATMGVAGVEKWWLLAISLLAVGVLLLGALHISRSSQTMRIQHLAQVDAKLLSNDLPLSAYTDPGFEQFLYNRQAAATGQMINRQLNGEANGQMGVMGQSVQTQ